MATEVWFRNPNNFVKELIECGQGNVTWERGLLVKKRIDPIKFMSLYYGLAIPYRQLLVGEQGSAEYGPGDTLDKPRAVYPTWSYGEDAVLLEEIVSSPVGMDADLVSDFSVKADERPVLGQEHRVVIIEPPNSNTGPGRSFLRYLKELQEEYPTCILHIHGLYGWRPAFGLGFAAADIDPRTPAHKGKVTVPAGREMTYESLAKHPQWVTPLGFKPADLAIPRNRCMYNIKSAVWAGKNYMELVKFKSKGTGKGINTFTPDNKYIPATTASYKSKQLKLVDGDKMLCNTCSLQLDCKYFRDGAVCSVPGAEPTPLARFFKTRDSEVIIDGLSIIMAAQTRRLERGMVAEEEYDELDPEVTKLLNSLFDQGVKLAKLVNPALRGGAKVGVFVGAGGATQISNDPRAFVGGVVRELEARGIPRNKITPELVQSTIEGMGDADKRVRAIEGQLVNRDEESDNEVQTL